MLTFKCTHVTIKLLLIHLIRYTGVEGMLKFNLGNNEQSSSTKMNSNKLQNNKYIAK